MVLVPSVSRGFKQMIAIVNVDGNYTISARSAVCFQAGFLNDTFFGTHHDEVVLDIGFIFKCFNRYKGFNMVIFVNLNQINNSPASAKSGTFRYFIDLEPVTFTFFQ